MKSTISPKLRNIGFSVALLLLLTALVGVSIESKLYRKFEEPIRVDLDPVLCGTTIETTVGLPPSGLRGSRFKVARVGCGCTYAVIVGDRSTFAGHAELAVKINTTCEKSNFFVVVDVVDEYDNRKEIYFNIHALKLAPERADARFNPKGEWDGWFWISSSDGSELALLDFQCELPDFGMVLSDQKAPGEPQMAMFEASNPEKLGDYRLDFTTNDPLLPNLTVVLNLRRGVHSSTGERDLGKVDPRPRTFGIVLQNDAKEEFEVIDFEVPDSASIVTALPKKSANFLANIMLELTPTTDGYAVLKFSVREENGRIYPVETTVRWELEPESETKE